MMNAEWRQAATDPRLS